MQRARPTLFFSVPRLWMKFYLAINIEAFIDPADFKREIDDVIRQMRSSPTLAGFDRVRLPGESAHTAYADRTANGGPLPEPLVNNLAGVAADLGVDELG